MRYASLRISICTTALVALAVAVAGQLPLVQAAPAPTPVPVAPAGGIDPAKLPDGQGIHLGMSPQDVLARFKSLYPDSTNKRTGTTPFYVQIQGSSDPQWLGRLGGTADLCGSSICDNMMVMFSGPPSQQRVVGIQRSLAFAPGHEASPDNVKAALFKKYGPNPVVLGSTLFSWVLDEQGQPADVPAAVARRRTQCASDFVSYVNSNPQLNGAQPLAQADIDRMMINPCRVGVVVYAQLSVGGINGTQVVSGFQVNLSENSEDTRDYIATVQHIAGQSATLRQKQMKDAQNVAAPAI